MRDILRFFLASHCFGKYTFYTTPNSITQGNGLLKDAFIITKKAITV